jgi:hypothetical protein
LQSNGGIVHIARKCELTAILAAADSDRVEVFREFLKLRACVVIAIEKYSQLLKAIAEKRNVDVVCELWEIGAVVEIFQKHGCAYFIIAAENGHMEVMFVLLNNVAN